jgi:uncharacterized repeat protein (TIGR01451 family)
MSRARTAPAWLFTIVASSILAGCDLELVKTAPAKAMPGDTITYTITITNKQSGSNSCTRDNIVVNDTLPAGVMFVSATASQGGCASPVGGVVTCALGSLGVPQSATIEIKVKATSVGTITNSATVAADPCSGFGDPNLANNTDTAETRVDPHQAAPAASAWSLAGLVLGFVLIGWAALRRRFASA